MTTNLPVITVASPFLKESTTPQLTTVSFTAGDATNGNDVSVASDIILILQNTGVGANTVTIDSGVDPYGRTATITDFSIAAGAFVARRFTAVGWEKVLGGASMEFTVSNVEVECLALAV